MRSQLSRLSVLCTLAQCPAARFQTNRPFRRFNPARLLPKFEIHDVRDDPAGGTMTRVAVDAKNMILTQYPQMGPRKADPNDITPQFDQSKRISTRFRHIDMAAMVAVTKGRLEEHHMKNNAFELTFKKTPEGGYSLQGKVKRAAGMPGSGFQKEMEDWGVVFDDHFAVALEHFLDTSLTESFGFLPYAVYQQERESFKNSANDSTTNNNASGSSRGEENRARNNSNNGRRNNNRNQRRNQNRNKSDEDSKQQDIEAPAEM